VRCTLLGRQLVRCTSLERPLAHCKMMERPLAHCKTLALVEVGVAACCTVENKSQHIEQDMSAGTQVLCNWPGTGPHKR